MDYCLNHRSRSSCCTGAAIDIHDGVSRSQLHSFGFGSGGLEGSCDGEKRKVAEKEELFQEAGIAVRYHEYVHPTYRQLFGEFIPSLAVVDYWLNATPEPPLISAS